MCGRGRGWSWDWDWDILVVVVVVWTEDKRMEVVRSKLGRCADLMTTMVVAGLGTVVTDDDVVMVVPAAAVADNAAEEVDGRVVVENNAADTLVAGGAARKVQVVDGCSSVVVGDVAVSAEVDNWGSWIGYDVLYVQRAGTGISGSHIELVIPVKHLRGRIVMLHQDWHGHTHGLVDAEAVGEHDDPLVVDVSTRRPLDWDRLGVVVVVLSPRMACVDVSTRRQPDWDRLVERLGVVVSSPRTACVE